MSLSDFFKPRWKHSNPLIRLAEVKKFGDENQALLANIVRKDSDPDVRRIALKKLSDSELLKVVAREDQDASIRKLADQKYCDDLAREIKNANKNTFGDFSGEFSDSKYFEDIAKNAKLPEIRLVALEQISRLNVLVMVASKDSDEQVALAAVKMISKPSSLQEVQSSSRFPSVRSYISEQLKGVRKEEKNLASEKLENQKREILLKTIKRAAKSRDPLDERDHIEGLQQEWKNLGNQELESEFQGAVEAFNQACVSQQEQIAAAHKAAQEEEEFLNVQNEICERIEMLANLGDSQKSAAQLGSVKQAWNELENPSSDMAKRFETALQRVERQMKLNQAKELDQQERKKQSIELLTQLKSLLEQDDQVDKQLQGISRQWEALGADEEADREFNEIKSKILENLSAVREANKQEVENKKSKLLEIIESINQLKEDKDFKDISIALRNAHADWKEIVGEQKGAFIELWNQFKDSTARFEEMRQWEQWHNLRDKESLCEEAEALKDVEGGKGLWDTVRNLQSQWKNSGHVSQNVSQELWDRFRNACDAAMERCEDFLKELNAERDNNLAAKEGLIAQLGEVLSAKVENWRDSSDMVKKLQNSWKEIGAVPREKSDEIWKKFRSLCDEFYAQHREFLKVEEKDRVENLKKKEVLCERAEAISSSTDWNKTTKQFRDIQAEWKRIGSVPRKDSDIIWKRFRLACDTFFDAKRDHFNQIDEEKQTNLKAKQELCERLEALDTDASDAWVQVQEISQQWKEIGSVPRDDSEKIWQRFCAQADKVYALQVERDPELKKEVDENLDLKRALIERARLASENPQMGEATQELKSIQDEWKNLGRIGNFDQELWVELREVCDAFFEKRRDQYEIMEQNRINNLEKKELLCEQAEKLEIGSFESKEEVRHLRRLWKEIGAVPRNDSDSIWNRFNSACDRVFEKVES